MRKKITEIGKEIAVIGISSSVDENKYQIFNNKPSTVSHIAMGPVQVG